MVLVSFKNIHIWLSIGQKMARMPIFRHTFFGLIGRIFYGSSEDHYLSIGDEKSKLQCLFFSFDFWATSGGKTGVATTRAPSGLEPPNPTKKLAHRVEILGPTTITK